MPFVAGIAIALTIMLGWGNWVFVSIGIICLITTGITANYSPKEIEAGEKPHPLVVILWPLSTLACIISAIYLLIVT